jgi:hypothetical protein
MNAPTLKVDKTRNSLSNSKMLSEEIGVKQSEGAKMLHKKLTLEGGKLNEDLEEAMNNVTPSKQPNADLQEELYYRLHKGLVKIQACFRGHLARMHVANILK